MRFFLLLFFISTSFFAQQSEKQSVDAVLEDWHNAAADADFDLYFGHMTDTSVFLGTDATENWTYQEFKDFSKPYFDKGKAWSFSTLERNIFVDQNTAWFDEHLDTQMGICRGSGVVKKVDGVWKIAHYVLSIAVPNENVSQLTAMKKTWDSIQMNIMRGRN